MGPFAAGVAAAAAVGALGLLLPALRQAVGCVGRFGAFLSAWRGVCAPAFERAVAAAMGATRGCAAGGSRGLASAPTALLAIRASGTGLDAVRRCSEGRSHGELAESA